MVMPAGKYGTLMRRGSAHGQMHGRERASLASTRDVLIGTERIEQNIILEGRLSIFGSYRNGRGEEAAACGLPVSDLYVELRLSRSVRYHPVATPGSRYGPPGHQRWAGELLEDVCSHNHRAEDEPSPGWDEISEHAERLSEESARDKAYASRICGLLGPELSYGRMWQYFKTSLAQRGMLTCLALHTRTALLGLWVTVSKVPYTDHHGFDRYDFRIIMATSDGSLIFDARCRPYRLFETFALGHLVLDDCIPLLVDELKQIQYRSWLHLAVDYDAVIGVPPGLADGTPYQNDYQAARRAFQSMVDLAAENEQRLPVAFDLENTESPRGMGQLVDIELAVLGVRNQEGAFFVIIEGHPWPVLRELCESGRCLLLTWGPDERNWLWQRGFVGHTLKDLQQAPEFLRNDDSCLERTDENGHHHRDRRGRPLQEGFWIARRVSSLYEDAEEQARWRGEPVYVKDPDGTSFHFPDGRTNYSRWSRIPLAHSSVGYAASDVVSLLVMYRLALGDVGYLDSAPPSPSYSGTSPLYSDVEVEDV